MQQIALSLRLLIVSFDSPEDYVSGAERNIHTKKTATTTNFLRTAGWTLRKNYQDNKGLLRTTDKKI